MERLQWLEGGRISTFRTLKFVEEGKKKKNLSMVSMYLQPEALHPLGNVIPWLPTHQIELSDSGMARQTSLTNIWQPGQDNVSPPSFE